MINLNNLTKETLIDIVMDLDYELGLVYNEGLPSYENRIQELEKALEDMNNKRKYWKDKSLSNYVKPERISISEKNSVNVLSPNRKIPMVPDGNGNFYPLDVIRKAQGNTMELNHTQRLPKVQQRSIDEVPKQQRAEEYKDRSNNSGGNWLGSAHVHHKRQGVGYEAEFQHDVKNKNGEVVINEGDVYQFEDLRSVEDFYIGKGIKKANWRANNLSTAITRRGGYMDSALWKYVDLEEVK